MFSVFKNTLDCQHLAHVFYSWYNVYSLHEGFCERISDFKRNGKVFDLTVQPSTIPPPLPPIKHIVPALAYYSAAQINA